MRSFRCLAILCCLAAATAAPLAAAPEAEPWPRWQAHDDTPDVEYGWALNDAAR